MRSLNIFNRIDTYAEPESVKEINIYPFFRQSVSEQGTEVFLKGNKRVLMFGSNSYMGLTTHPEVKDAAIAAIKRYGTGCTGSRLLNGTFDIHEKLEAELANWVGKEAALIYPTGFQVNQGVIAAVLSRADHIILDFNNHASIIDGARISLASIHRYAHSDMQKLARVLNGISTEVGKFIVSDGVFSMEGDIVNLPELVRLARQYNAVVMIDDAHALGLLGHEGSGTASHFGLSNEVDFIMGTFSKSLASLGGFVAADKQSIGYLKHHSRAFLFSASLPPASVAAALAAVRIIRREPERITRLWRNATMMRDGLNAAGFDTGLSTTPVIPVHVVEAELMMHMCKQLEDKGVYVNAVLPPAVPPGKSLLRISLMATHTRSQIDFALEIIEQVGKKLGVV